MVLVLWCDVGGGGVEENLCPATSSSSGAGRRWNEEVCAPSDCTLAPADMHAVSSLQTILGHQQTCMPCLASLDSGGGSQFSKGSTNSESFKNEMMMMINLS